MLEKVYLLERGIARADSSEPPVVRKSNTVINLSKAGISQARISKKRRLLKPLRLETLILRPLKTLGLS